MSDAFSDGMNNIGKPVPEFRRETAYKWLRELFQPEKATELVGFVSSKLERDQPYEAMQGSLARGLDLTGTYRLFAYLLTGEEQIEVQCEHCAIDVELIDGFHFQNGFIVGPCMKFPA